MGLWNKIKAWVKSHDFPKLDPSKFNDPLALEVEWTPLKKGGSNFKTHGLKETAPGRYEYLPSGCGLTFMYTFVVVGVLVFGVSLYAVQTGSDGAWVGVAVGAMFGIVGAIAIRMLKVRKVFDINRKMYWIKYNEPRDIPLKQNQLYPIEFEDIAAFQLIREYIKGDKSSYYSYEFNLVLKDAMRINVVDFGHKKSLIFEMAQLAILMDKPIWDATVPGGEAVLDFSDLRKIVEEHQSIEQLRKSPPVRYRK